MVESAQPTRVDQPVEASVDNGRLRHPAGAQGEGDRRGTPATTVCVLVTAIVLAVPAMAALRAKDRDATAVVREFCRMDSEAHRLDGRVSRPLWNLTSGEGEPPDWPLSLIAGYRVHTAKVAGAAAVVAVDYEVIGEVGDEPFDVHAFKKTEHAAFYLNRAAAGWRIDVGRLKVTPHVLPGPLARYFERLLAETPSPEMPERRTMLERTIRSLRKMSAPRGGRRP